ncbi:hypothetical protein EKO27_g4394 [Xylaria grammica]|uniref:Uncharacterized protein n=1 Tax=Xylaria grammica TaxID=363999 RepID=A0A439D8I9_9PEZI|nr:hypothetical protein EKO27_g4394 [Xylaria grammica]
MPTAPGVFLRLSDTQIALHFDIEGVQYSFNATVSPPTQPFVSRTVVLTYENIGQLSGSQRYNGHVGERDFKLDINGLEITGNLEDPGLPYAAVIYGSGSWESDS